MQARGGGVTNKMLGVGRGQKRTVKLGRERFECWPLSWKQSTVLFGWSEFEPSPHAGMGSCTGVSVLVLTCGLTKLFWINSKTCINLMVTNQDLAHYCNQLNLLILFTNYTVKALLATTLS